MIDRSDLKPQLISGEGKRTRLMDTIGVTRGFGDHDIEHAYSPGLKIRSFMLPDAEVSSPQYRSRILSFPPCASALPIRPPFPYEPSRSLSLSISSPYVFVAFFKLMI